MGNAKERYVSLPDSVRAADQTEVVSPCLCYLGAGVSHTTSFALPRNISPTIQYPVAALPSEFIAFVLGSPMIAAALKLVSVSFWEAVMLVRGYEVMLTRPLSTD